MPIAKKLPASESGPGVRCITQKGDAYIISQCPAPLRFTLWRQAEKGYEKIKTGSSPEELYEEIPWGTNKK